MEVILREDVKTLGKAGALVRVKPGYARNFLLPHGLAYEATEGNKKRLAAESKASESSAFRRANSSGVKRSNSSTYRVATSAYHSATPPRDTTTSRAGSTP